MVPQSPAIREIDASVREAIARIAARFAIDGEWVVGEEIKSGHINSTFRVTLESAGVRRRYILQRITERVFKDPLAVMRNVERVTRHIRDRMPRAQADPADRTLRLHPARSGQWWVAGPDGGIWRCYNFIEGCHTCETVGTTRQAFQAARAFGTFQQRVSDLPAAEIEETIPHFHDTRRRYERLIEVAAADPCGRAGPAGPELDFIRRREGDVDRILELQASGGIPLRITHNDTKISNVMIDGATDEAVCVIDLDTVMPGSVLHDFGDLARTVVSPAAEDERDLSKVAVRMPMFEALVEGYLGAARSFLDGAEVAHLAFSAKLVTLEVAIRFLTDFLEGDVYFRTERADHNIDRARAQLALVGHLEAQLPAMERFVSKAWKGV